jgi:hypothetical protein
MTVAADEYTIDTSILIGLERRYPRDVFPSLWNNLESLIEEGRACICSEVLDETSRGNDDLHRWAKDQGGFCCQPEGVDFRIVAEIGVALPEWVRGDKNAADPFVIGHAIAHSRTIVVDETRAGPGVIARNQKIPNVADGYSVDSIDFIELARREGWRL